MNTYKKSIVTLQKMSRNYSTVAQSVIKYIKQKEMKEYIWFYQPKRIELNVKNAIGALQQITNQVRIVMKAIQYLEK